MKGTKKRFTRSSKKSTFKFFLTCKCIFDLYEHCKFEYVPEPLWGVYRFLRKFNKIYGDEGPMAPKEIEVISFLG